MNLTNQQPYQKHTPKRHTPGKDERGHWAYEYGTNSEYLHWVSLQPSVIDNDWNQLNPNRNIPCHVRRQKRGAGTGIKPAYSAVSMTQEQHDIQTRYGEAECLRQFRAGAWTDESAKAFFEDAADAMLERWIKEKRFKIPTPAMD